MVEQVAVQKAEEGEDFLSLLLNLARKYGYLRLENVKIEADTIEVWVEEGSKSPPTLSITLQQGPTYKVSLFKSD